MTAPAFIRSLLPRWLYFSPYAAEHPFMLEYWNSDEQWRASIHLTWIWRGRGRSLCVFLPDFMP